MTDLLIKTPHAPIAEASLTHSERRRARYLKLTRAALNDERVRSVGRLIVRHGAYAIGGTRALARRAWDGRTAARYERMIRAAESAGLMEEVREWEARGHAFREARHRRRMDLLAALLNAPKAIASALATGAGVLLLLGLLLAWANNDVSDVLAPAHAVIETVRLVALIAGVVWDPMLFALPWIALAAVWAIGRHSRTAPQWALPPHQRDDGGPVTPSIVVTAFRDLGISALRRAIEDMGDVGAAMLSPIVMAGCGVEVDVTLPSGVSTDEIQKRRRKLAENLGRHEHEVFVTIPEAARTVRLWIADSGALDEPIGPSPLVTDPDSRADYRTGRAPWGQSLRGDATAVSLYQRHLLITGLSNQGKTAALRALALWLALDASVEFWIGDLKGVGDWAMFEGLASVLIQGPTDEHACAVTEMVEAGVQEMERRLMAPPGSVFDPLVILVDEAQVAFMNPVKGPDGRPYGGSKATSRYFMAARRIHNQGRAVSVTLWQGTQNPTDQNLPVLVREGAHIRSSLVVGTESQSKMALGDKAVDGGAAPHLLRQGLDKGTLVVAGDGVELEPGQSSITIRTHFIDDEQAREITNRAKAARSGVATVHKLTPVRDVDPLADILTVLGTEPRMRTQEVLQRLAERDPGTYREWHNSDLRELLEGFDAAPHKSDGVMVVDRQKVRDALAERDAA
ncbi:ATP-binding protein [Streptomyces albicerus]|uniref:ATP-binding protein n=1 Tax=Streptomyces albicerus TaxID=2569859 RepID=UPI00124B45CF|nr:ATP-binding protein [Streptomyces albicerus]